MTRDQNYENLQTQLCYTDFSNYNKLLLFAILT